MLDVFGNTIKENPRLRIDPMHRLLVGEVLRTEFELSGPIPLTDLLAFLPRGRYPERWKQILEKKIMKDCSTRRRIATRVRNLQPKESLYSLYPSSSEAKPQQALRPVKKFHNWEIFTVEMLAKMHRGEVDLMWRTDSQSATSPAHYVALALWEEADRRIG